MNKKKTYTNYPLSASNDACQALRWHEKHGSGLTRVGLARANQLCKRKPVSHKTLQRVDRFFNRHSAFKKHHTMKPKPSNSLISWKAWGGDSMRLWAKKKLK